MRNNFVWALTFCMLAAPPFAAAEMQFNGFASVVTGIDLKDEGASNYGNRTVDNLQESRVALQWTADIEKGLRFVGQTVARGNATTGFALNYDWAYFDFNVGDSAKLKFGRLRIPFYKYSDYLDVGYAYHWITPPKSMYSLAFSNMDGIGYQHNLEAGGMEHALNFTVGTYQGVLRILAGLPIDSRLENLMAVNWSTTMDNHEIYAAYAQADVYMDASDLVGLSALAASPRDVVVDGDYGFFVGIGYKGMFGDINVFFEYSIVEVQDTIVSDTSGGYLGTSYTMGDYTYHVTYGIRKEDEKTYSGGNSDTDIGLALGATASGSTLNSTARSLGNGDSSTITLGVRKDIGASTALKIDLDLYTEDKVQDDQVASASAERKATTLKFAIESMF